MNFFKINIIEPIETIRINRFTSSNQQNIQIHETISEIVEDMDGNYENDFNYYDNNDNEINDNDSTTINDNFKFQEDERDPMVNFDEFTKNSIKYKILFKNDNDSVSDERLFPDSPYCLKDFSIAIIYIRTRFANLGDEAISAIIGLFAQFLPADNAIKRYLQKKRTSYQSTQLVLHALGENKPKLPCRVFRKCRTGCHIFTANDTTNSCSICNLPKEVSLVSYYLPIKQRLLMLLNSPLLQLLLFYDNFREKNDQIISDIYDGSNWKEFQSAMKKNEILIGLEMCWDGTVTFKNGKKSMWPICYCILNLPPVLRGKLHLGLHMCGIDDGNHAIWECVVHELNDLWINGFEFNGKKYRIALLRITMDGRGLEHFTKTSG